jgi:hypothetical protein
MGRYRSGQTGRTVNPLAYAFAGSNPALPTISKAFTRRGLLGAAGSVALGADASKQMTHLEFFRGEILGVVRIWFRGYRDTLNDFQAVPFQPYHFLGVVG